MNYLTTGQIVENFFIKEEQLNEYLASKNIIVSNKGIINPKHNQMIISFIESIKDERVENALKTEKEFFKTENNMVSIYQDDSIEFLSKLPSNSIDLIITDPAYSGMNNKLKLGKGRIVGKYNEKGSKEGKWFTEFEDTEENYNKFLFQCKRVLKETTGHIYIMFDSFSLLTLGSFVRQYFDVKNLITWDKVNLGMGHYYRRRHEYIMFATKGNNRKIRNRCFPDVWRFKRIHNSKYPTQKPVEIFQTMIYASAEKNFVVCDPFLGSGSSAIAALKNNCKFIGCDISDKSVVLSKDRIIKFLETGIDELQKEPASLKDEKIFWE